MGSKRIDGCSKDETEIARVAYDRAKNINANENNAYGAMALAA